jgi:acid phosphatase family membrane protein YuiD
MAGFAAWVLAQFIKMALALAHGVNREAFKRFWASGGFPSSHAATVTALAAACGIEFGFGSGYFAVAAVYALVVIYDAFTLRQEAGKHAELLNKIIEDFYRYKRFEAKHLKELLGHTRFEVFFGFLLGIAVAFFIVR